MGWFAGVFSTRIKKTALNTEIEFAKYTLAQKATRAGYTEIIKWDRRTYCDDYEIVLKCCRWTPVARLVYLYLDHIIRVYSHYVYKQVKPPRIISQNSAPFVTTEFTLYLDFTTSGDAWMGVIRDNIDGFLTKCPNICPCSGCDVRLTRTTVDNVLKLDFKLLYYFIIEQR